LHLRDDDPSDRLGKVLGALRQVVSFQRSGVGFHLQTGLQLFCLDAGAVAMRELRLCILDRQHDRAGLHRGARKA
jgi:hypothetical protein